jgi:hypothetical protein
MASTRAEVGQRQEEVSVVTSVNKRVVVGLDPRGEASALQNALPLASGQTADIWCE